VALVACIAARAVLAQAVPSFELERLQLDPAARGSLVLGTGEVAPRNTFRLSGAGQWQERPLVLVGGGDLLGRRGDDAARTLVQVRKSLHLTLDYVILPRVELYGRANFIIDQDYGPAAALRIPGRVGPLDDSGWGMPSFGLRIGLLQQPDGTNIAVAGEFFPGWGDPDLLARWERREAGLVRLEIGRNIGPAVVAVNGGYLFRDKLTIGTREYGSEAQGGIVLAGRRWLRPELSFRGAVGVTGDRDPGSAELLGGLRLVGGPFEIFALGGPGFFNRPGTPEWRALAGLALGAEGEKKREPAPPPPPPPPPPTPAPKEEPAPPPPPPDPCAPGQPHTPEQCPDLDDDGDGVVNGKDECPTESGLVELKGCPSRDSDGDGVADHLDRCATEPGQADNQGCPRVVIQKETRKVELREQVQFDLGKATIRPESAALLDEIANVLRAHPEVKKVQVEGHTDSTGGQAVNQRLSRQRAAAVVRALTERGIEPERLSSRGFGPSRPIAPNDTPEGRQQNRRVEIQITEQGE
jgi:outer membrane protein OmpA-like peptidoglycan-associated protein